MERDKSGILDPGSRRKEIEAGSPNVVIADIDTTERKQPSAKRKTYTGPMSSEQADKMVAAFRDIGPNMSKVSRACGLDRRTVAKAWKHGVKAHGLAPIAAILETEQAAAREKVAQRWAAEATKDAKVAGMDIAKHAKARENMADDAIRGRTEEANMVRLARGDATQCLAAVARLLPGLNKWAKFTAETLDTSNPKNLQDTVKLMSDVSKVVERAANAANTIMAMERRLLGQPESIVGVQMPDLSMEEALTHYNAMAKTMARGQALGLFPQYLNNKPIEIVDIDPDLPDFEGENDDDALVIADS